MASDRETAPTVTPPPARGRSPWLFSWPLILGALAYVLAVHAVETLLKDGDTFLHIAIGHWMFQHGAVPAADPFSHTMPGAPWIAHEWLAAVVLALAHAGGGWTGVVALSALAFAVTLALLMRALLDQLEPVYALLFVVIAAALTAPHLLARPHLLAMPFMMLWTIGLVRASEAGRAPSLWLLPLMTVWANLHGGFTLGLVLAGAFALEALLAARQQGRLGATARAWGLFLLLAGASALLTPYGAKGILFTWHLLANTSYALTVIGEWQPANFQQLQPLEVWLLAGLALFAYQGLRLPPMRLLLLLGLLHLALKHARNSELLGLLSPLFLATPLAAQWRARQQGQVPLAAADRFFRRLAQPAGRSAALSAVLLLSAYTLFLPRLRAVEPPVAAAPVQAIQAVQQAGLRGPVLNEYGWGGYLSFLGIRPFIDGRVDVYGDEFLKAYMAAIFVQQPDALESVLRKYDIEWTLLSPGTPALAWLDRMPGWQRLYGDTTAIVHARRPVDAPAPPAR